MKTRASYLVALLLLVLLAFSAGMAEAKAKPKMATGKKKASTISLRGTAAIQRQQNIVADKQKLPRVKSEKHLRKLIKERKLVHLPVAKYVTVDRGLPRTLQYCHPRVRTWLFDVNRDYGVWASSEAKKCPRCNNEIHPWRVTSAVRTPEHQLALRNGNKKGRGRNVNAARVSGPMASSHLTGATIDISQLRHTPKEVRWMQQRLLTGKNAGTVIPVEEHRPGSKVFHTMVVRVPGPGKAVKKGKVGSASRRSPAAKAKATKPHAAKAPPRAGAKKK
jgi:hypothetical protein